MGGKIMTEKSSYEVDQEMQKYQTELKEVISMHEIVEQEKLNLQYQIVELQLKKKKFEMSLSESSTRIKLLQINVKMAQAEFWAIKNENR